MQNALYYQLLWWKEKVPNMKKKYDVIALGELLVDMAEGPASAQNNMTFEACPGGAPCNVLACLAALGHSVGFVGKVGDDFLGHMLGNTIESVGIDSSHLIYDPDAKTTLAFVHKKEDGDRDFSFYRKPGADMLLHEDEVDACYISAAKIFHFGTLSMTDEAVRSATKKAVTIAKNNGMLISFDPNLREPLWDSLEDAKNQMLWGLEQCDILKISDNEVEFLTGKSKPEEMMEALLPLTSARLVTLTLGADGSMAYAGNGLVTMPGVKMEQIVDTTGAGDTFMGCVLHYVLNHSMELTDANLLEMLQMANANAAQITQVKGALRAMKMFETK